MSVEARDSRTIDNGCVRAFVDPDAGAWIWNPYSAKEPVWIPRDVLVALAKETLRSFDLGTQS